MMKPGAVHTFLPALLALVLHSLPSAAMATGLLEAWQAARAHDKEYAVARAAHEAAQTLREQAHALWRPNLHLSGAAGVAGNETDTRGAQFSAPGFGQSADVGFSTSVTRGTASRLALVATQPLYNPKRHAEQRQLDRTADLGALQWQSAEQSLILRTAEHYFALAIAEESVRIYRQQLDAVQKAAQEAQERFKLGDAPVTDTHEALAQLATLQAQVLAAESDLQLKRNLLADRTGLAPDALSANLPGGEKGAAEQLAPLDFWLTEAQANNPEIHAQRLAAEVAKQEAEKHSPSASASVDLIAQAGKERLSGSGHFGDASNSGTNWMVGVQLTVPLFTGGYRSAKQAEALHLLDKAQAQSEQTKEHIAQQVRAAWLGLSVGAERIKALEQAQQASQARLDATRLGRKIGERTTLELLNAENELATTSLSLAQARAELLLNRLRIRALIGQLDETALQAAQSALATTAASR